MLPTPQLSPYHIYIIVFVVSFTRLGLWAASAVDDDVEES